MTKSLRFLLMSMFIMLTGSVMADVTDVLKAGVFGVSGTSYTDFSQKSASSKAVYAGQCAATDNTIQLRSKNSNSGVVTTTSGGKVLSITVKFNSKTTTGRTVSIYGKTTAYEAATDLYDANKQGTLIKDVIVDDGTEQTVTVTGNYTFIGFRSKADALYLDEVQVKWDGEAGEGGGSITPDPVVADTLTVANALEMLASMAANQKTEAQYVKGIISKIDTVNISKGNATFYISDNGAEEGQFMIYNAYDLGNVKFTSKDDIKVGDVVIVNGPLVNYRSSKAAETDPVTPEMTTPCYIVKQNGKTERVVKPVELKTAANIKAFLALTAGDEATLTLTDAQVTYVNVNNDKTDLFVRDNTGAIDLYDLGIEATVGQKLNGTINVKLGANSGFVAAVKGTNELSSTIVASAGGDVTVTAIDPREALNYYCDYVAFKNVTINNKKAFNEDGDSLVLYDRFSLGLIDGLKTDGTKYDLYGLMYDGGTKFGPELVVTKATLAGGGEIVDDPVNFTGAGTLENPYTVADLLQLNPAKIADYIAAEKVWVKGVIVTSINNNALETTPSMVSNIAIADQAGEKDYAATIPVELKNNTAFRTNLNVVDNPTNIGKEILLYGKVDKYYQKPGVKNLSDYVLDGQQYTITSINEVKAAERFQGAIYNLSGQRVKTPAKGLFILNGKKYFVK